MSGKMKCTNETDAGGKDVELDIPRKANWIMILETKFTCSVVGHDYCYVTPDGQHKKILHSDLGWWANMIIGLSSLVYAPKPYCSTHRKMMLPLWIWRNHRAV